MAYKALQQYLGGFVVYRGENVYLPKNKLNAIMAEENQDKKINIELSEEVGQGTYANLAMIAHSNSEFVVDFVRLMPGIPKAKVQSRIILTPEHAKRLLNALDDNIKKYEASFGPIKPSQEGPKFPMNFGGTMGEA